MANGSMWSLVRHDMKFCSRRRNKLPRAWRMAYLAIALIVLVVITVHESANTVQVLNYIWFFTFIFPFMAFGISVAMTAREWRNGTVEWWLTLPMSRLRLVTAKVFAAILRSLIIYAAAYVVVSIICIYTQLIQGNGLGHEVSQFLISGLKWMGLVAAVTPFAGTLGILFGILRHSHARPAIPLIWLLYMALWWSGIHHIGDGIQTIGSGSDITYLAPAVWWAIIVSWLVSFGLIRLASYLLEKQIAM